MGNHTATIIDGKSGTIRSYCEEELCNVREFEARIKVPFDGEKQVVGLDKPFCPLCGKNPARWWSWDPLREADKLNGFRVGLRDSPSAIKERAFRERVQELKQALKEAEEKGDYAVIRDLALLRMELQRRYELHD